MQTGTIVRKNTNGYGFISREGAEGDLFFHANELVGTSFDDIREGDKVTFEVIDSPDKPGKQNAIKVSLA
ncbi:hypothetical protein A3C89_01145 [Candidatus Kaiserbacteria bacterium RIFCSPHIGHO2_02_FULL_50_50]|uniref:CSD domain-containing protein n=1 Tax=Candidatus Kaiserbacteria bacterium RIFCSPHIGHO2_02_FULL_50_50 TaxID=1798492 RepID=A0A1F6DDQ2_9BACT|nr:MAG: hypothetical protein A3C89_01145 [Candidatus Kaiserbacteria bacterium RIFCSPHIGHO2_02_FULL_50_50]OGG88728.1 MAG: hypothetical protein A3G62_00545 [Candidatus Kaiserbacteria bacterium RIFCSPLOWO2_12_FULL_50_10]